MKNHALRPLWLALALVGTILIVRHFLVPKDFGVHGRNFTYGFHRLSSIDEWKAFTVKYKGKEYCADCHEEKVQENLKSKHRDIQCENCHGPALEHPDNPEKLVVERSRELCLRCHAKLEYPNSNRGSLKGVDPASHNPEAVCSECHNPHKPDREGL
ncbi:MAG: cytochrome c3 family protein [Desulfobulbaceae bacterium]|nr:cytochrome c3 family protein [Desulfobulbaceae bacterium]HIJ78067.1 cytochrome C [Deltaproteobacteria bacterium]